MSTNTTDRELLELAAKAAGIGGRYESWCGPGYGFMQGIRRTGDPKEYKVWNPALYSDHRYELARTLNMAIEFDTCTVGAKMPNGNWMWIGWSEKDLKGLHKTDADAILALAAEIGRQMP